MGAPTAGLEFERYRRELTGYCYRMLASPFDAEDAVQETLLRAWHGLDSFDEAKGGLRPWLYRIATNVCLDMLKGAKRRALSIELGPAGSGEDRLRAPLPEATWIQPIPDAALHLRSDGDDPAAVVLGRETVRLAFIAALQHLAPRQRAVLILRDALSWRTSEVAALLNLSDDAVNGVLKRARQALIDARLETTAHAGPEVEQQLLERYVSAMERYDVDALVALLQEDGLITMPPFELWIRGREQIRTFLAGMRNEAGHDRVLRTHANGSPAVAVYRPDAAGVEQPYALMVLEVSGEQIAAIHAFLDPALFPVFGF